MSQDLYTQLAMTVIEGEEELAVSLTRQPLEQGLSPLEIIEKGLAPASGGG